MTLRTFLIGCSIWFCATLSIDAQHDQLPQDGPVGERIDRMRQLILTREMNLTEAEAEAFFPVFWEREAERRSLMHDLRQQRVRGRQSLREMSEEQAREHLQRLSRMQELRQELDRKYQSRFLEVIPAGKLILLEPAERAFRKRLLRRLRERRGDYSNRRNRRGR